MRLHQGEIHDLFRGTVVAAVVAFVLCRPSSTPGQTVAFTQVPVAASQQVAEAPRFSRLPYRDIEAARLMLIRFGTGSSEPICITPDFTAAMDPSVSFDGRRLLFAGKKPGQPWQIYERRLRNGQTRQLTRAPTDCVMPIYLPNGNIVFVSPNTPTSLSSTVAKSQSEDLSLYCLHPGGQLSRISFAPGSQTEPAVLNDGRIVYVSQTPPIDPEGDSQSELSIVNSDGTGVRGLAGSSLASWPVRSPAVGDDGQIAYLAVERQHPFSAGVMRLFSLGDVTGDHAQPLGERLVQVADVASLPATRSRSTNGSPPTVGAQNWLLSMRPAEAPSFGLYRLDGEVATLLFTDPHSHSLQPVALTQRTRPHARQSVVDPSVDWGELLCQNVYCTRPELAGRIPPGVVTRVRVLEGLGRVADRSKLTFDKLVPPPATAVRILGEAPVQSDGSFYAKVPADRPLRLQLIDDEGFVTVNQKSWFWVRPKESRMCVGCHADSELSFDNVVPLAFQRPPTDLTDSSHWRRLSFRRNVLPVLTSTCGVTGCHRPPEPTAGMDLSELQQPSDRDPPWVSHVGPALSRLLATQPDKPVSVGGRLVHPGNARESPLMWMLYGRQLGRGFAAAPFDLQVTEPHLDEELPDDLLTIIRTWIEIGAPYDIGAPYEVSVHDETRSGESLFNTTLSKRMMEARK